MSAHHPVLSQQRSLVLVALATGVVALVVGLAIGLTATQWLTYGVAVSLVLWVGGAVSGQVLLARLLDGERSGPETVAYLRQLLWIIPRFYVPLGLVAVGCGLGLVALGPAQLSDTQVIVPLTLYVLTAIAGSALSAPGYIRLLRAADEYGADHPDLRRRLLPLAWLNRTELALVIGVGFTLLTSAI